MRRPGDGWAQGHSDEPAAACLLAALGEVGPPDRASLAAAVRPLNKVLDLALIMDAYQTEHLARRWSW